MSSSEHWEEFYANRATEELGWYEPQPSTLDLVLRFSRPSDSVVDVGAGDSHLTDALGQAGYDDITVVDLSETALGRLRSRLGPAARNVTFVQADITNWEPPRTWDLWHDRAVFHFMVDAVDREAYKAAALKSLPAGGHLVVAAFAPDGPEQCAGLPVERYDADSLAAVFAPELQLVEHHAVRAGSTGDSDQRPYVAAVLERL